MAAEEKTQGEGGGDETNEERVEIRQGETRGRGGARTHAEGHIRVHDEGSWG